MRRPQQSSRLRRSENPFLRLKNLKPKATLTAVPGGSFSHKIPCHIDTLVFEAEGPVNFIITLHVSLPHTGTDPAAQGRSLSSGTEEVSSRSGDVGRRMFKCCRPIRRRVVTTD
jgi:hypothetical protein